MESRILNAYETLFCFGKTEIKYSGHINKLDYKTFLPEDLLIKFCQKELKIDVDKSDINKLLQDKLIEANKSKNEKDSKYPLHTILRVEFLTKLKAKYDFPLPALQQIIAYEDAQIQQLLFQLFYEKTFDPVKWATKELKTAYDYDVEETKKDIAGGWDDDGYFKHILGIQGQLKKISNKRSWNQLTKDEKALLTDRIWQERSNEEYRIYLVLNDYHNSILKGYSPQVKLKDSKVDWEKTHKNLELDTFSDFSYFSTPDFKVDFTEKRITIDILNPHAVKSLEMREIGKIYTVFAERLGSKRRKWGENSGRKLQIQERNKQLRELYRKFKKDKSNISSELLIEKYLVPFCANLGLPASVERIQKIIYSKE